MWPKWYCGALSDVPEFVNDAPPSACFYRVQTSLAGANRVSRSLTGPIERQPDIAHSDVLC